MSKLFVRSRPLARIAPILFGTWLVLPACSAKVELGQAAGAGGTAGDGSVGGASVGGGVITDGGSVTTIGGSIAYPNTSNVAGSGAYTTSIVGVGGATVATTSAVSSFLVQPRSHISGIDLLLMIDNSASMADKQATLAAAVPQLLGQLAQPNCVDSKGNYIGPSTLGAATPCATGTPEFNPINNIHIGVITSSLGDHGANTICTPGTPTNYTDTNGAQIPQPADVNDMGRLVGTLDRATAARADAQSQYATLNALGFLAWGNATLPTPGAADLTAAAKIFTDLVSATRESGCGYESQLESWFRFLIDPVPPVLPLAAPVSNYTVRTGSDDTLLNQRAAFLRPDSVVAIIMLTDENDCSIRDTDVGWVSATSASITGGSSQCATNPNDVCCHSCTAGAPSGCSNGCNSSPGAAADDGPYQANIRCWNQKRRFGYEFLYPTSRYVVGLTKPELCPDQSFGDMDCDCTYAKSVGAGCNPGSRRMPNPLYSTIAGTLNDGKTAIAGYPDALPRSDNSLVFLTGIVGVPWQDIGTVSADGSLKYIPVIDPAWTSSPSNAGNTPVNPPTNGAGIWDMIYGKDAANIVPKDIHMVESLVPRSGLPGPTAAANADAFTGHEYNTAREDFEYACIYPLPASRPCACDPTSATYASCKYQHPNDCCDTAYKSDGVGGPGDDYHKPVCNGTTQVAAKAYPGLREIEVLHDYALTNAAAAVQGNSIVASICPKDLSSEPSSPGYGYNPAVSTLIDRIKTSLKGSCLARPLSVNIDGTVPCQVVEAVTPSSLNGATCAAFCSAHRRSEYVGPAGGYGSGSSTVSEPTVTLRNAHICDTSGGIACANMCLCVLHQETGTYLATCQNNPDGPAITSLPPGYCYVDPANSAGTNSALVSHCPAAQQRILRFVGSNPSAGNAVPLENSYVLEYCAGG